MFNIKLIIVRCSKIAITEAVFYLVTGGDEVSIDISIINIPGKFCFYGACRNIRIDSNGAAAAPVFSIGGSHSYSIRSRGHFELSAEAIIIAAGADKS